MFAATEMIDGNILWVLISALGAGVLLSLLTYDKADAYVKAWKHRTGCNKGKM